MILAGALCSTVVEVTLCALRRPSFRETSRQGFIKLVVSASRRFGSRSYSAETPSAASESFKHFVGKLPYLEDKSTASFVIRKYAVFFAPDGYCRRISLSRLYFLDRREPRFKMKLIISAFFTFVASSLIPLPHHDTHFTTEYLKRRITWYAQDHFTNYCYHPCKVKTFFSKKSASK